MDQEPEHQEKLDKLAKIERQNRQRARRFLAARKAKGKQQISAIIHKNAYEKINRRRDLSINVGTPLTAGDIIEQALNFTEMFISFDGTLDFILLDEMEQAHQQINDIDASIDKNINSNSTNNNNVNININTALKNKLKKSDSKPEKPEPPVNVDSLKVVTTPPLEFEDEEDTSVYEIKISDEDAVESVKAFEAMVEPKKLTPPNEYPNSQSELFQEDISAPPSMDVENIFNNPPSIDDSDTYREWINNVLLEISGDGLSNKDICTELMERKILTPKGAEKWFPVAVAAMLKHLR